MDHILMVEVGFPSEAEPLLLPHIEMNQRWVEELNDSVDMTHEELCESATNQVYPWTPIDVVLMVIRKHGGRKSSGSVFTEAQKLSQYPVRRRTL